MNKPIDKFSLAEYPAGSVTQYFGENPKLYASMGMKGHNGIDIVAVHGTPLLSVEAGTVIDVKLSEDGYGRHLRIIGTAKNGICNIWTYGHCDTILVSVGDKVKAGQTVATMGNTGFVVTGKTPFWKSNPFAGTHLHLGLRQVKRDPKGWAYNGSKIKISVLNYENGYKGSIDPFDYLKSVSKEVSDSNWTDKSKLFDTINQLKTKLNGLLNGK